MSGIIINIDPVIFRLGGAELRWYSLAIMLAVLAAVVIAVKQGREKDIEASEIYSLVPWVLIGGIAGARLFHVIDQWGYYRENLLQILWFQQGGLAIWGALVGGGVAVIIFSRMRHLPLARLADVLVPAILTAQIIGRVGCIVNGDAYGGVTGLPWGFIYVHPDALIPPSFFGVPTHPYPVYEMIWNGVALLLILRFKGYFRQDGLLFLSYAAHYSVVRFVLTFVRQENAFLWGLQQAQLLAIISLIASMALIGFLLRKAKNNMSSAGSGVQPL